MIKIEYEIKLNDDGIPYISLSPDYVDKSEDKFFVIEMTRYFLQSVYVNAEDGKYDENTMNYMKNSIILLEQLSDEMKKLLLEDMKMSGEISMIMGSAYHVVVESIEERDNLSFDYFIYNEKLYKREIGLKVYVNNYECDRENSGVHVLKNGITNENWVKIK